MERITRLAGSRPQLEVRDLELVLSLSATGSTSAAASALHITQSAVSRALGGAEERLGVRLFERTARGVVPTAAGARLIAGAGALLLELGELERRVSAPEAPKPRLRVVCECYTAYRWLPSAMARQSERLPGFQVDIESDHTTDPVAALLENRIEVALLTTGRLPGTREARGAFVEEPLFSDEVVFVVGASHALASAKHLTPADLLRHPLITSNAPAAEARWFIASVFGRKKPRLDFLRLPLTEAIMDAARAGMGIAVLSEWMAGGYLGAGDLVVKRLAKGPLRRPWRVAYRRDVADTARPLVALIAASAPRLARAVPRERRRVSFVGAGRERAVRH